MHHDPDAFLPPRSPMHHDPNALPPTRSWSVHHDPNALPPTRSPMRRSTLPRPSTLPPPRSPVHHDPNALPPTRSPMRRSTLPRPSTLPPPRSPVREDAYFDDDRSPVLGPSPWPVHEDTTSLTPRSHARAAQRDFVKRAERDIDTFEDHRVHHIDTFEGADSVTDGPSSPTAVSNRPKAFVPPVRAPPAPVPAEGASVSTEDDARSRIPGLPENPASPRLRAALPQDSGPHTSEPVGESPRPPAGGALLAPNSARRRKRVWV